MEGRSRAICLLSWMPVRRGEDVTCLYFRYVCCIFHNCYWILFIVQTRQVYLPSRLEPRSHLEPNKTEPYQSCRVGRASKYLSADCLSHTRSQNHLPKDATVVRVPKPRLIPNEIPGREDISVPDRDPAKPHALANVTQHDDRYSAREWQKSPRGRSCVI